MKYIVKFEHRPEWGNFTDLHDESQWIVTEQEINDFIEQEYWTIDATLLKSRKKVSAKFYGKDRKINISSKEELDGILKELENAEYKVEEVKKGQPIGSIVDSMSGDVNEIVLAPETGFVFTLREYPIVYEGSLIVRILGGTK